MSKTPVSAPEAAHLLLHSRKRVFIGGTDLANTNPQEEEEANAWAANFLIPQQALQSFIKRFSFRESDVVDFVKEQGIAPGIVVGQLQKRGVLQYNQMNQLKDRYEWRA
jgi:Zn-dependent peptidase ImmA (M78 family)